ncbi:hypothetical protein K439DRAFT_892534 [Ramaria rubella]|nr:hypothetical protein K439DRAFT_892534 [Ramaria rubella]
MDKEAQRLLRREATVYQTWLTDKALPVPIFHGYYQSQAGGVLILQDCGIALKHVSPSTWSRVCQAVLKLHQRGLHHHDLRLSNIAMDRRGRISILDWATATEASECGGECSDAIFLQSQGV